MTHVDTGTPGPASQLAPARASRLRRFPGAVLARGSAVRLLLRRGVDPVAAFAEHRQAERRDVLGIVVHGRAEADGVPAEPAMLWVPQDADARAYPRAVNGIPIQILRAPEQPQL